MFESAFLPAQLGWGVVLFWLAPGFASLFTQQAPRPVLPARQASGLRAGRARMHFPARPSV